MTSLARYVIANVEGQGRIPSEEQPEARILIQSWVWAAPLTAVVLVVFIANGWRLQMLVTALTMLTGALLVLGLRAGLLKVRSFSNLSLLVAVLNLSIGTLGQTPFDPSSTFFLSVVPLGAGFLGGYRRGAIWSVICAIFGLTALQLGARGYTYPTVNPSPLTTMSANFGILLVLTLVLVRSYQTERELALSKMRAADRAKSVFLANVSHEIRTPMNGVVGMTEVLLSQEQLPAQREQLEVIRRCGQAMVLLINDLLDVARLEEGKLALSLAPFDLHVVVSDVARLYAPLAELKGLPLKVTLGADVPRSVIGDALRLRQVFSNLLSNAVKFTEQGEVRFQIQRDGPELRFEVIDTGPGIPASVAPRLFQRFEQGDASATRRAGGTGLGLALSREFVGLMGGVLSLDAEHHPGCRFTFSLRLPEGPGEGTSPGRPSLAAERRGGRVLVVDDNPINVAVARSLVKLAGYEVAVATNGREALEAVQGSTFRLVLMDVQMPEMDGLEATRRIRQLPGAVALVPIVTLTASVMPEDREACLAAGANDMLAKPIDVRALHALLEQYAS